MGSLTPHYSFYLTHPDDLIDPIVNFADNFLVLDEILFGLESSSASAILGASFVTFGSHASLTGEKVLGTDVIMRGLIADRSAATTAGLLHFTTDVGGGTLYRASGSTWEQVGLGLTALTTHEAAGDPHTGYQKESEKGQANGYASLDGSSLIPDAQVPSTIARDSEVTSAVSTHAGLADPHTGYQKESEKAAAGGYASLDGSILVPQAQIPTSLDATARVGVRKNSTGSVFSRRRLNLIEGTNVTLTVADDSGNEEVDITINASTSGGSAHIIKENGSPLTARSGLNFATGLIATDDAGNDETDVNLDFSGDNTWTGTGTTSFAGTVTVSTALSVGGNAVLTAGSSTVFFKNVDQTLSDGVDITVGSTTGTKIGTATSEKIGFFNASPVVQIAGTTDVLAGLVTLGLRAASSNPPLNLGSGALTAGASTLGATTATSLSIGANAVLTVATATVFFKDVDQTLSDGTDIAVGATTGTKIGTATTQKLGFFNATPVVQRPNTTDLKVVLTDLGLLASGGTTPLNIGTGALTAGASTLGATTVTTFGTGGDVTLADGNNIIVNATTGTKIGTATSQKLGFFNATPVAQISGSTDVLAGMVTLGFRAASSNPPLNLGSGALTAGASTLGATTTTSLSVGGNTALTTSSGVQLSTLTTKGDLYAATASAAVARVAVGANKTRLTADSAQSTGVSWQEVQTERMWAFSGTLVTGTVGKARWYADKSYTIKSIRASVNTAPTGSPTVVIDANKNGTTVFTTQGNRPTIAASSFTSGLVTNMDVTSLTAGDYLQVDIDTVGGTIAGADLTVQIVLAEV